MFSAERFLGVFDRDLSGFCRMLEMMVAPDRFYPVLAILFENPDYLARFHCLSLMLIA
jgi:hypothetical protein